MSKSTKMVIVISEINLILIKWEKSKKWGFNNDKENNVSYCNFYNCIVGSRRM